MLGSTLNAQYMETYGSTYDDYIKTTSFLGGAGYSMYHNNYVKGVLEAQVNAYGFGLIQSAGYRGFNGVNGDSAYYFSFDVYPGGSPVTYDVPNADFGLFLVRNTPPTLVSPAPLPAPNNLGKSDPNCPSACEGNPINAATGNKFQTETDYVGAANTHLELRRYYNSQDLTSSAFGDKWHSTYHRGLTQSDSTHVAVTRADGRTNTFTLAAGVWTSTPDVTSQLTAINTNSAQTGWKLVTEDDESESYSLDGRLLSITTRAGLITQLTYDVNNRLTKVTAPFGQTLSFTYDGAGHVTQVTLPDGNIYTYGYDATNDLTSVAYSNTLTRTYVYDTIAGLTGKTLTGIIDENGIRFATWTYDALGHALTSTHAGGAEFTTLAYNNNGTVTATDARNNAHTYNFTIQFGKFKPISVSGTPCLSCGGTAFTYDANGFIASQTDFNGNVTNFTYNARGLETSRTEAYGTPLARTITTAWHTTFHLPTTITEPNRITSFTYDAKGNLTKKTVTAGTLIRTWVYTYNTFGQVTQVDAPRTDVTDITKYAYDTKGNLISVTNALAQITKITSYDANGRPLILVDANGLTTTLAYDIRGKLLSHNVGGEITTYAYDKVGQLLRLTQPDGSQINYSYDQAHRLTQISDSLGNKMVYTLDASGNQTAKQIYDPSNTLMRSQTQQFNELNRLAKFIDANGQATVLEYDSNGNLRDATDPLNNISSADYDALNRLVANIDPAANQTQDQYDANDNPVQVTDPRGAVTRSIYDGLGNKIQLVSPDTGTTNKTYNSAGNMLTSTDARGKKTSYTYDALNRVTKMTFATGTAVAFTYDAATNAKGRLVTVTDESGSSAWTYDIHGRVTTKTQIIGGVTRKTAYAYDSAGRLIKTTYPSGNVVNTTYDGNGRVLQLALGATPIVKNIQYTPFSAAASWVWGNNQNYNRTFDQNGRLTSYPLGSRTRSLDYDPASHITDYTDSDISKSQYFIYDAASRLVSATYTPIGLNPVQTQQNFIYDTNGNRASKIVNTVSSVQTTYAYNTSGNKLSSTTLQGNPAVPYLYDAAGNILSVAGNTFVYSDRGRLITANGTQYLVNGLGQRVKKSVPSNTTLFAYDEAGHLIGEYGASGTVIRETVYLGDTPVAMIVGGVASYIHTDHLNAPRAIVNAAGVTVWRWDSEPFGKDYPNEDPDGNGVKVIYNLRFPGQYYDSETGLHYNYFRDYSPNLGRYIQSDPIGLAGGLNTYGYVGGNPVSGVDPRGLDEIIWTPGPGRSIWDGAKNGNFGGKKWTGGNNGISLPTDSGDECYQRHDGCYDRNVGGDKAKTAICDRKLINDLSRLSSNPKLWENPPRSGTEGGSYWFGEAAIAYFGYGMQNSERDKFSDAVDRYKEVYDTKF